MGETAAAGRGELSFGRSVAMGERRRLILRTSGLTIAAVLFALVLGFSIAGQTGWWHRYGDGGVVVEGGMRDLTACVDLPQQIPIDRLAETAGCDASGHEVIFPTGDTIVIDPETPEMVVMSGYEIAVYPVGRSGVAARYQDSATVQYWGHVEAVRRVMYAEGLPD